MPVTLASTTDSKEQVEAAANAAAGVTAEEPKGEQKVEEVSGATEVKAEPKEEGQPAKEASEPTEGAGDKEKEGKPEEGKVEGQQDGKKRDDEPAWAKKRFAKLTRQREEAREKAEAAERRIAELEKKLAAEKPQGEGAAKDEDPEPKEDQFEDWTKYADARMEWKHRQILKAEQAEAAVKAKADADQKAAEAQEARDKADRKLLEDHNARVDEAKEAHEDWDEVVTPDIVLPSIAQVAIVNSEHSAELLYHLCKHEDVRQRLVKLNETNPPLVMREIYRIERDLETPKSETPPEPTPKSKPAASKATEPIKPLTGRTAISSSPLSGDMSYADYKKRRLAGER